MTDDLVGRLHKLLEAATPGDLSTAQRHIECETVECPLCHEGEVEASDYCNFDGKALGVQFYGIGKEFGAHEKLWTETIAALPTLLARIEALEGENRKLRDLLGDLEQSATGVYRRGAVTGPHWSRLGGDLILARATLAKDHPHAD